ncbi:MAG: hypothetical protein QXS27_04800 [Candidatus Jordarchaeaceae archaeon]
MKHKNEHGNHQHENEHENQHEKLGTQRLKALISHWIEHNTGHLEKIIEYARILEESGTSEVAEHLNEAAEHLQKSIEALKSALKHA